MHFKDSDNYSINNQNLNSSTIEELTQQLNNKTIIADAFYKLSTDYMKKHITNHEFTDLYIQCIRAIEKQNIPLN